MSSRLSTHLPDDVHDDGEDYVLVDARAVLLDLADEPRGRVRPLLRGVQPPPAASPCDPEIEWRAFLGAARRGVAAEDTPASSVWQRVARRLQSVWSGARGGAGRGR